MNVLVADDDAISRRILVATLQRFGHAVETAADGREAWARLEAAACPDLLVLDWQMPGLDGPEICRRLRSRHDRRYCYTILATSSDSPHYVAEGLEAGADDFIAKPFDVEELRARVRAGQRIVELQAEMLRTQAYLEAVLANIESGVLLVDHGGRVVYANDALIRLSGMSIDKISSSTRNEFAQLLAARFADPKALLDRVGAEASLPSDSELDLELSKPERRVLRWSAKRVALPDGDGRLDLYRDVTAEVDRDREHAKRARIDHLTGLYNRHAAEEIFSRELARARRTRCPLSLVLADIDFFKRVNDTFGHKVGDLVLREVGHTLVRCSRGTDVTIRWGGEELLVVLPDTALAGASMLAERMRAAVETLELPDLPRVTISCGVAEMSADDATLENTLERADGRLYAAKASGRNAVR